MTQFIRLSNTSTNETIRLNVAEITVYMESESDPDSNIHSVLRTRTGELFKVSDTVEEIDGMIVNARKHAIVSQG